jgi:hypothetical protein
MQVPPEPLPGSRPAVGPQTPVPPPVSSPAVPQVPEALTRAVQSMVRDHSWRATEVFQEALCAYVSELRASGLDVVKTLLTVKNALGAVPAKLLEQSVKWCIEAYYRPD